MKTRAVLLLLLFAAALTRALQSAVISNDERPDADDVHLLLTQINRLILDASDQLEQGALA